MKLTILLGIFGVVLAGTSSAAPLCTFGTIASYEALGAGGCVIGDKVFSNFVYASTSGGTGVAVADTAVFVTPVVPVGPNLYSPGPGLIFSSAGWFVPSASTTSPSFVDSSFSFTVTVMNSAAALLEDGTLILSSYAVSGTGLADITETINPASIQLQVDSAGPFTDHKSFTPTTSVNVLKDLLVAVPRDRTGNGAGTAQIFSFEEDFSQVSSAPEPVGSFLIGSGLLALGFWRSRAARRG